MGRPQARLLLALLAAVAVTGAAGCTQTVAGSPAVAPPQIITATPPPAGTATAAEAPSSVPVATAVAGPATLLPDVLADECLLDASQLTALLGRPIRPPAQTEVRRDDGSHSSSCYAGPVAGEPGPVAAINVYRVRGGTPARFVTAAAAGGRVLTGVGTAATVLDTAAGPTLQVASARFVVTIVVMGREPDDLAWRAAARAALARLPR